MKAFCLSYFLFFSTLLSLSPTKGIAQALEPIDDLIGQFRHTDQQNLYLISSPQLLHEHQILDIFKKYQISILDEALIQLIDQLYQSLDTNHSVLALENTEKQESLLFFVPKAGVSIESIRAKIHPDWLPRISIFPKAGRFAIEILSQPILDPSARTLEAWLEKKPMLALDIPHHRFNQCPMKQGEADLWIIYQNQACLNLSWQSQSIQIDVKLYEDIKALESILSQLKPIEWIDPQALFSFSIKLSTALSQQLLALIPIEAQKNAPQLFQQLTQSWDGNLLISWHSAKHFALILGQQGNQQTQQFSQSSIVLSPTEKLQVRNDVSNIQIYYQQAIKPMITPQKQSLLSLNIKSSGLPKNATDLKDLAVHQLQINPSDLQSFDWLFELLAKGNQWIGDIKIDLYQLRLGTYQLSLNIKLF